jgi:DNA-binding response OmpR family regulator
MEGYQDLDLAVDLERKAVLVTSKIVSLTRKEYDLLAILVQNSGEIVARESLLLEVWGYGKEIRTRTLDVHIRRLRKKLAPAGERYIETIFGVGYRFQPRRTPLPIAVHTSVALSA